MYSAVTIENAQLRLSVRQQKNQDKYHSDVPKSRLIETTMFCWRVNWKIPEKGSLLNTFVLTLRAYWALLAARSK